MFGLLGICLPVIVSGERCRSEINELVADDAHPVPTFDVQQLIVPLSDMGGNGQTEFKKEILLNKYTTFIKKFVAGNLTSHQSQLYNTL